LHLRMQRHSENGLAVAQFLNSHPKINTVFYPGLASHPNHDIAISQMNNFGGMLSFNLKSGAKSDSFKLLENLKVFTLAESLGSVESLANHPAVMTHASVPASQREKIGITEDLIRLSVGVEDIADLLADLTTALETI
jgi:cystathionine beta-lyase/cystathionine gamma-synthase